MRPRFSLRDTFGCLTTICVIAGLLHGGLNYPEPYATFCALGLGVLGIVRFFFASWRNQTPRPPET